ncbi:MAG: hypothetical protein ACUVX8_18295, partial [Candidatus Zipacnadales bacterium]
MSDNAKKLILLVTIGIVVALAFLGFRVWQSRRSTIVTAQLETAQVTRGNIEATVSASGNLAPSRRVNLAFMMAGRVESIFVSEGTVV